MNETIMLQIAGIMRHRALWHVCSSYSTDTSSLADHSFALFSTLYAPKKRSRSSLVPGRWERPGFFGKWSATESSPLGYPISSRLELESRRDQPDLLYICLPLRVLRVLVAMHIR